MGVGDGYILQNARWMHGRTAFSGQREMHRLLGRVRHGSGIPVGLPIGTSVETDQEVA